MDASAIASALTAQTALNQSKGLMAIKQAAQSQQQIADVVSEAGRQALSAPGAGRASLVDVSV